MTPSRHQVASLAASLSDGQAELLFMAVAGTMARVGIKPGQPFEPVEDPDPCREQDLLRWLKNLPTLDRFEDPPPPPDDASPQFIDRYESMKAAHLISRQRLEQSYSIVADLHKTLEVKLGLIEVPEAFNAAALRELGEMTPENDSE